MVLLGRQEKNLGICPLDKCSVSRSLCLCICASGLGRLIAQSYGKGSNGLRYIWLLFHFLFVHTPNASCHLLSPSWLSPADGSSWFLCQLSSVWSWQMDGRIPDGKGGEGPWYLSPLLPNLGSYFCVSPSHPTGLLFSSPHP